MILLLSHAHNSSNLLLGFSCCYASVVRRISVWGLCACVCVCENLATCPCLCGCVCAFWQADQIEFFGGETDMKGKRL